jgi:hypothetical protein
LLNIVNIYKTLSTETLFSSSSIYLNLVLVEKKVMFFVEAFSEEFMGN